MSRMSFNRSLTSLRSIGDGIRTVGEGIRRRTESMRSRGGGEEVE